MKGRLADDVLVVLSRSPNNWVDLCDQFSSRHRGVAFNDPSDLDQERFHVLRGRLDEDLAVVLAYILTEEVKPILDVRDDRLFG